MVVAVSQEELEEDLGRGCMETSHITLMGLSMPHFDSSSSDESLSSSTERALAVGGEWC